MASTEMIWLLIANASRARIFEWVKGQGGHLREVADFVHPQSRMKGSELSSDRAGHTQRTQGDSDVGGASLDHRSEARRKEHVLFARELGDHIDKALTAHRFSAWVLVASNPFLGELNTQLSPACSKALTAKLASDWTDLDLPQIEQRLTALELLR